jgi:type IV secretion system protein TrbC
MFIYVSQNHKEDFMPRTEQSFSGSKRNPFLITRWFFRALLLFLWAAGPAYAQSPWENAVDVLRTSFTGTIARGLSLVAIVVGGLMFAFGEGDSKRTLAGIVFGVGMAIGAVNFMNWLFP